MCWCLMILIEWQSAHRIVRGLNGPALCLSQFTEGDTPLSPDADSLSDSDGDSPVESFEGHRMIACFDAIGSNIIGDMAAFEHALPSLPLIWNISLLALTVYFPTDVINVKLARNTCNRKLRQKIHFGFLYQRFLIIQIQYSAFNNKGVDFNG